MPVGYLMNGCISGEENLRTILQARAEVGHNYFAGIASNEHDPNGSIDTLCRKLGYALRSGYLPPQNFYGIGGMKVFRDLIWLMQGMMKADHKFYKAQGQYDFPQKQWPRMLAMYGVGYLMGNEKLKQKAGSKMTEGMLMPYNRVLEKARQNMNK